MVVLAFAGKISDCVFVCTSIDLCNGVCNHVSRAVIIAMV